MVTFNSENEATKAMEALNNTKLPDNAFGPIMEMRKPTKAEIREFARIKGRQSKQYQSLPFITEKDLECLLSRSQFMRTDERRICREWIRALHSLLTAWAQTQKGNEWKESNHKDTNETWETQIMREQGISRTMMTFTKWQEQILSFMEENDNDLLEAWTR